MGRRGRAAAAAALCLLLAAPASAYNLVRFGVYDADVSPGDGWTLMTPLDFSAHFLEAEHEGGVTAIDASPDGLKLLIGTASGTIGVLDVPTLKHATIVRSHTDIIYGLAMDPHNREFVTASCDGSIRVWELDGNQSQLVEFELPAGCARAVAYHPTEYAIACGFDDMDIICELTDDELREDIGIEKKGHRRKMLKAMQIYAQKNEGTRHH